MKIVLLSGSFHSKSRSLAVLDAIQHYFPEHHYVLPRLNELPFYCEDLNKQKPAGVKAFLADIDTCDGILVCTPEYNHSIPAVLKNAIDWASRPAFNSVLKGKPVSIISQGVSPVGGARAQAHLKLVFDSTLSVIHTTHEMMIPGIDTVFNESLSVIDQKVEARLKRHVSDFFDAIHP
jgi:chromate reductase